MVTSATTVLVNASEEPAADADSSFKSLASLEEEAKLSGLPLREIREAYIDADHHGKTTPGLLSLYSSSVLLYRSSGSSDLHLYLYFLSAL